MSESKHTPEVMALATSLYEALAKDAGWRHSPAHDGWVNDDYQDNPDEDSDGYEVANTAEDICFCYDVPCGDESSKLAAAAERHARLLDDALAFIKSIEWWNNRWAESCPVCEELQRKGHAPDCALNAILAKAEGR